MRKILMAALATISMTAMAATTNQSTTTLDTSTHKIGVGLEPIWLIIGGLGAKADMKITDKMSLGLGGMYVPSHSTTSTADSSVEYKFSTYEVYLGPTFFVTGLYDTNGWYVTPAVGRKGINISDYGSQKLGGSLDTWEGRLTAGYQWVTSENLRLTAGGGLRLLTANDVVVKNANGQEVYKGNSGTLGELALDLQISYMF